mgnify:CR=1 FL=1
MKLSNIKYLAAAAILSLTAVSCDKYLDKPTEDNYVADGYYKTDAECLAGTAYLYSSPWYDFQRGFIKVGEVFSGNYYWGSSPYMNFTLNGSDQDLINMSYALWAAIAHTNTVYNYVAGGGASQATKDQCMGECLVWKAMAYFFLVRSFGEIPIVHDTSAELASGGYSTAPKVKKADVYEYIIMTLEKAMEILPKTPLEKGRFDYYCAEGLLAKVYLTKAGVSGSLNADDLQKAAQYAKDVIDNSGRHLLSNYADVFRLQNNKSEESLIAFRWSCINGEWTAQNTLQSDLFANGFDEFGDLWGGWNGISVDLQNAFGVDLTTQQPDAWINNVDTRLKATMMLPGFKYDYFWQDHDMGGGQKGFDYLKFIFDDAYNPSVQVTDGQIVCQSATGSNTVKHLYGDDYDHVTGTGHNAARMSYSLATHILRLSDVYLVYAEAMLGANRGSTSNSDAIDAFYAVHHRAIPNYERPASISWSDIWKERRLELAMEGDRWYDYVRVSYYDPDFCVNELNNQKRNALWNISDCYRTYYETGSWPGGIVYDEQTARPNISSLMKRDPDSGKMNFYMPFPSEDVIFNLNLGSSVDGVHVDVRSTYSY